MEESVKKDEDIKADGECLNPKANNESDSETEKKDEESTTDVTPDSSHENANTENNLSEIDDGKVLKSENSDNNIQTLKIDQCTSPAPGFGPTIISVLAILISLSTLFATLYTKGDTISEMIEQGMGVLDTRLEKVDRRVEGIEHTLSNNKNDMVSMELKKMLATVQGISSIMEGDTKIKIRKVEKELISLVKKAHDSKRKDKMHWGYTGNTGPDYWGKMNPAFSLCSNGKNQSPIDLSGMLVLNAEPKDIGFSYNRQPVQVVNNGHTIQVKFEDGNRALINGKSYNMLQIHFHSPSENTINGRSFPMEAHIVHSDKEGNIAVIAIMFSEGKSNDFIKAIWEHMPDNESKTIFINNIKTGIIDMLPRNHDYYRYNGSFTTPPCTEGILWLVMKTPVEISREQIEGFKKIMHHGNNRPTQPIGARVVLM